MGYVRTVAPTVGAVPLEEALQHCRVIDQQDYPYVSALLARAERYAERRINRQLITATWELRLDSFPSEIRLIVLPVISVTSIYYIDADGTSTLLAATGYQTDFKTPDAPCRIMPAYGEVWPSTRADTYNAVTVTFTAGYGSASTSVPQTIRHAILLLVDHWYSHREPAQSDVLTPIPVGLEALLAIEEWGEYG